MSITSPPFRRLRHCFEVTNFFDTINDPHELTDALHHIYNFMRNLWFKLEHLLCSQIISCGWQKELKVCLSKRKIAFLNERKSLIALNIWEHTSFSFMVNIDSICEKVNQRLLLEC